MYKMILTTMLEMVIIIRQGGRPFLGLGGSRQCKKPVLLYVWTPRIREQHQVIYRKKGHEDNRKQRRR
jgi:hypothetical protein